MGYGFILVGWVVAAPNQPLSGNFATAECLERPPSALPHDELWSKNCEPRQRRGAEQSPIRFRGLRRDNRDFSGQVGQLVFRPKFTIKELFH